MIVISSHNLVEFNFDHDQLSQDTEERNWGEREREKKKTGVVSSISGQHRSGLLMLKKKSQMLRSTHAETILDLRSTYLSVGAWIQFLPSADSTYSRPYLTSPIISSGIQLALD